MRNAIFWPLIAQVLLVAVVAGRMYAVRVAEMRARRIRPQAVATSRTAAEALQNVAAADNFRNLFEVPVLFFAVCCALAITDTVTALQLVLAWSYVGLRAIHSFIHIIWVSDVDALHSEFVSRGAKIDYGLCNQSYGCREFGIQDLDGHDIGFGQVIK